MTRDIKDCEAEVDILLKENKELYAHIAELEAPISCDGCKWWDNIQDIHERAHPNWRYCDFKNNITFYQETENTFYCRDYEPKD